MLASSTRIFNSGKIVNFEKFIFLKAKDQQKDRGGETETEIETAESNRNQNVLLQKHNGLLAKEKNKKVAK